MTRRFASCLLTGAALLLAGTALAAHHAESAQFDANNPVEVTGVIKKVEWANPHIWFYVDVKDDTGKVTTWTISGAGPGGFRDIGISGRDVFKTGETYTAIAARARDGSPNGYILTFILPDGRKIDLWHQYKSEAATGK
jgi:hypothetical protein